MVFGYFLISHKPREDVVNFTLENNQGPLRPGGEGRGVPPVFVRQVRVVVVGVVGVRGR